MIWRLNPLSSLHWRRWGDDWAVFDAASGLTHRLNTLGATSLLLLQEQPADSAELGNRLDEALQIGAEADLSSAVSATLRQLEVAGLVHNAPD